MSAFKQAKDGKCIKCGEGDLYHDIMEHSGLASISQRVSCDCGAQWWEVYELASIEDEDSNVIAKHPMLEALASVAVELENSIGGEPLNEQWMLEMVNKVIAQAEGRTA
jgi:hypothetical protein